ncbi:MAG: flavodoxin family protein [Pseudomonadota bacterium]
MKVCCILGSPRAGGNSDTIATAFCNSAGECGANLEIFALRDLQFSGCRNLFHCKNGGDACGLQDDLQTVLATIRESDIVVLATPVYFTDISSQLKACIDRWFSFFVPSYPTAENKSRLAPGKEIVWIQTQGEPAAQYADLNEKYDHSFSMLGFHPSHLLRASSTREIGEVPSEVLQQASELAREMLSQAL